MSVPIQTLRRMAQAEPHPGSLIVQALTERGMSQAELARRLMLSPKHMNRICRGHEAVSPRVALGLERVLQIPARLWLCAQMDYELARLRLELITELEPVAIAPKRLPPARHA